MSNVQRVQMKRAMAPARGITTTKIERLKADGWQIVDTRRVNGMVEHVLTRPDYAANQRAAARERRREARRLGRQRKVEGRGTLVDRMERWVSDAEDRQREKRLARERLARERDPLRGRFVPRNDPRHPEHPDYRPPVWEHVDVRPASQPAVRPAAPRPGRWGPFSMIARWFDRADDAWVARRQRHIQARDPSQVSAGQRKPEQSP